MARRDSAKQQGSPFHRLLGNRITEENYIFHLFLVVCFAIHSVFFLIFLSIHESVMMVVNVGSVTLYITLEYMLIRNKNPISIFMAAYTEVLLHATLACLLLGWQYGFGMLIVVVIPLLFYLPFKNPAFPYFFSILASLAFFAVQAVCFYFPPPENAQVTPTGKLLISLMNGLCLCAALIIFSCVYRNITHSAQEELSQENQHLQELADRDPLTGLLNRRSMMTCLKRAEASRETGVLFSIALCDIDDFKMVNDVYGHDCGDYVLKTLASLMKSNVRRGDAVCRWGGEEILVLFSYAGEEQARSAMEHLRAAIEGYSFSYHGQELKITITIGGAWEPLPINDMILKADENLYFGKKHGKNQAVI